MDAFLALMQVGRGGDWTDRGLPEVVTGYGSSPSAVAAGAEWMFDTHPSPIGDDWRLLVWTDIRTGGWHHDRPDAVVTPSLYRAAIAERGLQPASMRRRMLAADPVTSKVRASLVEIGDRVLLSPRATNAAARTPGSWFVADYVADDCVAARVNGRGVLTRANREVITFITPLGEIDRIPGDTPVIPVEEKN